VFVCVERAPRTFIDRLGSVFVLDPVGCAMLRCCSNSKLWEGLCWDRGASTLEVKSLGLDAKRNERLM
jgi:hypothetical protein